MSSVRILVLATLVFSCVTVRGAVAQIGNGETGMLLAKRSGGAGVLCGRAFTCSGLATILRRSEQVTLSIRGVRNQPFALFLGIGARPVCLTIPGIHNQLFEFPILVAASGVLTTQDTVRACPGGLESFTFTVPATLPIGSHIVFQALAWSYYQSSQVPTFTVAVDATVQ
ncbi:MAG: hypothetical protein KDC95_11710 [Planctomycetes bacterium]|nr:hypothetical protein [Planctomycetota bacterium]